MLSRHPWPLFYCPTPMPDRSDLKSPDSDPKSPLESVSRPKRWTDFDWVWNTLSVCCLIASGSFMTNTAQAFSKGGWDVLQTLGTVSQGAGLVFVTGGALTDRGRSALKTVLQSLNIQPEYQAEVTCAGAFLTLACSYGIYHSLGSLGDYYYRQGTQAYDAGRIAAAIDGLEEAHNFDPNDPKINIALGNFYQKARQHELALPFYQQAALFGEPEAFNGLGRATMRLDPSLEGLEQAEVFFLIGLSQAQKVTHGPAIEAFILTHLGFVYVQQAEIFTALPPQQWDLKSVGLPQDSNPVQTLQTMAYETLMQANEKMEQVNPTTPGAGMQTCYLAALLVDQGQTEAAQAQWQVCIDRARPATLGQFQDILNYAGPAIARQINTSGIITHTAVTP